MSDVARTEERIAAFAEYARNLKGDEKSEAQIFCEHLFQAFGWKNLQQAKATCEHRITVAEPGKRKKTLYADLVWGSTLLIEMKSRGTRLEQHHRQAFEYWQYCTPHPQYVILCNFDEFWIYDFNNQIWEPLDRLTLDTLGKRYTALNFLFPEPKTPLFKNDRVAVTRDAAEHVSTVFNLLIKRGIERPVAQRFTLQCVLSLFAEDIGLLPRGLFSELIADCKNGESSYDLIGTLFQWMNSKSRAKHGRFKSVPYFNGGLFSEIEPVQLSLDELDLLALAAKEDWSMVQPPIFGTLFQGSMGKERRHAYGAHFTNEADIQRIVLPTIVRPWRERIRKASTLEELTQLRNQLVSFRVLDPACGSGNFLYVAYREIIRLEMELVQKMRQEFVSAKAGSRKVATSAFVSVKNFYGIDLDPFAVELAKVTLLLGKKLAYDEIRATFDIDQLGIELESPLPLDNLDSNIKEADALFTNWPKADVVIGNPPFQSKNKMQSEFKLEYIQRLREAYPEVSGMSDYCVYWFRKAHDFLPPGARAGLVGTNTIRQNESRESGLGYITKTGTITEAVSSEVWSGDAAVNVSIVNWTKSKSVPGKKSLSWQEGDKKSSPWKTIEVDSIGASLSPNTDVSAAKALAANADSEYCYQGQTHGHEGFLLSPEEAEEMLSANKKNAEVIFPFLIGDDLLGRKDGTPSRYVIDFGDRDVLESRTYKLPFRRVEQMVLPARREAAENEAERNAELLKTNPKAKVNRHHAQFLDHWWRLSWRRGEMLAAISGLSRYIVCVRVTKRPIFEFVSQSIRPNDALVVFPLEDDYSFGILQSSIHWAWFVERCSTLKRDFRYTSNTVFDSFPWPQAPDQKQVIRVASAARELRIKRTELGKKHNQTRRELYRLLETPGSHPLRDAHQALDQAVREAYGMRANADVLRFLLDLNLGLADLESEEKPVVGPGLKALGLSVAVERKCMSDDCIEI